LVNQPRPGRFAYYNDGRHYSFYRFEPPMTVTQLQRVVDEVAGTLVDTLLYGMGLGNVYLHGTKIGDPWWVVWPRKTATWWRAGENARILLEAGHDPMRVVAERAHEKGLAMIAAMRVNPPGNPETMPFYRDHRELLIGKGEGIPKRVENCLDFTHAEARKWRLDMVEETCREYPIDGFELIFVDEPDFFKPSEARMKCPYVTEFVRDARKTLNKVEEETGRSLTLAARIWAYRERCLESGLDVEAWLKEGSVQMLNVFGLSQLLDPEMPIDWLLRAAHDSHCRLFVSLPQQVYDDRNEDPGIEMYRAAAMNYWQAGVDGVILHDLPWPHSGREYQILRELGDLGLIAKKDKHYFVNWVVPGDNYALKRLPLTLTPVEAGHGQTVALNIGDDVAAARDMLIGAKLRLKVLRLTSKDKIEVFLNGVPLPVEHAAKTIWYGGWIHPGVSRWGLPNRLDTYYWMELDLDNESLPRKGRNEVEIAVRRRNPIFEGDLVVHDAEIILRYKEPPKPTGLVI